MIFENKGQGLKNDSHLSATALRTKVSKGRKDGVIKKRPDESLDSSGEI